MTSPTMSNGFFIACAAIFLLAFSGMAAEYFVIPFNVDPPIQVDGNLDDWQDVPNSIHLANAAHVTWFKEAKSKVWQGPQDLSATVRLAWRHDGIFVSADVTDDIVQQPYRGREVWKGDYVNLWLDLRPTLEPSRSLLGNGQYHIGMTPGNFNGTAGGEGVIEPRVFAFMPQNLPLENGVVAARRTADGYVIEAFLPFADLEIEGIKRDTYATFEIAVSDSDDTPATQQMIMTSGTDKWALLRTRFLPLLFGDGNGEATGPDRTMRIGNELHFKGKQSHTLKFTLEAQSEGMDAFLFFRARSRTKRPAGYCNWALAVELNGKRLEEDRLSNRPATMRMKNGHELNVIDTVGRLTLPHEQAFGSTDKDDHYQIKGQNVSEFEFNLEQVVKAGENTLVFRNTSRMWKDAYPQLAVDGVQLRTRPRRAGSSLSRPAPTGPLPVCEPQREFPKTYTALDWQAARIRLTVNGEPFAITSRFSAPDGEWHTGTTRYFTHRRDVQPKNEWIIVKDTFTNQTQDDLPLMYAHRCELAGRRANVYLGGCKLGAKQARRTDQANPTAYGTTAKSGLGLVALNDEFRVHVEQAVAGDSHEIGDFSFALKPGAQYTAEWAIVAVTEPDLWRFVNTARRMLDVNFTLDLMFAFAMQGPPVYDWSDAKLKSYIDNKSANFVVQSNYGVQYKGKPARNTAWMMGPHNQYRDFQKRIRKLYPDGSVRTGIYYHCFLDTYEPNNERFAADRALDAKGRHISYGSGRHKDMKLFVPTLENGFGKEIARWIDMILDDIGADGVFWDEFSRSKVDYCYNTWDGCSADIDRRTFKIQRRKGSLTLISRAFREHHVKRIMAGGAPLLVNGAPRTRTLSRHKFMAFTETGSIAHCTKMQLYSPVALGDHLTEREPKQAYRVMLKALDHGCLYAWYANRVFPRHKMLTEHMYPFTPIELHHGYVIGRERILTNRSGLFGWADRSEFTAYVYDREGKETDKYRAKKVILDGKTYAEVRIPGGCSAAVVRSENR